MDINTNTLKAIIISALFCVGTLIYIDKNYEAKLDSQYQHSIDYPNQ